MRDVAWRRAVGGSIVLHAAALLLQFVPPRHAVAAAPAPTLTDFWGGTTFDVPELTGDLSWANPASEEQESASKINAEEVDPSAGARSRNAHEQAPPSADATAAPTSKAKPSTVAAKARPSSRAGAGNAETSTAGSQGSASSGTFGAEGAAAGVRDLVRSFVRAIPIVASTDPVWATLPLGAAGSADVTLALDGQGKPFTPHPLESATPAHLRRLVLKTLAVMSGGRFGVDPNDVPAAEQKLRIAIILTQQDPPPASEAAAGGAFGLRFESADAHRVSRGFFTLASGRRVEVSVRPLGAK